MNSKKRKRRGFGFAETCFGLCSHLSLSSPRLLGHPPLRGASPLWPEWRKESAGPAFLSASSFLQTNLFIYLSKRFSLALPCFFYSSPSFLFSLFSSSAGASLSHPVLSSLLNFSTCPPYSRGSERKGTGSVGYSCGKHFQTCTKLNSLHKIATNCIVFGRKSESKSKHL